MNSAIKIKRTVILATASPARRKLVADTGIKFKACSVDIDETPKRGERIARYVKRLAVAKAREVRNLGNDAIVVAVDTAIGIDGEIIGKPKDAAHARRILKKLSGRTHDVASAIATRDLATKKIKTHITKTKVEFVKITKDILGWYISTGEWRNRAGAYAIQGKGSALVKSVRGCFTNVIGISIPALLEILNNSKTN